MERMKVLVPQYMKTFQCIGGACEENCCATSWGIHVDKKTYERYRKLPKSPIKTLLEKHVTRNRTAPVYIETYAKINFLGAKQCSFLCEDGLCDIQRNFGETYLCDVCATYPRYTNIIDGKYEISASLSCPEAARAALLDKTGVDFEEIEINYHGRKLINIEINTEKTNVNYHKYFWELRIFTIQILKSRDYELWERLIILGLFYQSIQECIDSGKVLDIPSIIEKYTAMVIQGIFKDSLRDIPIKITVQIEILKQMLKERCTQRLESSLYIECLNAVLEGIHLTNEVDDQETESAYLKSYHEYYQPFMKNHDYIIENYLVNYVFKNAFPIGGEKRIFDNYIMLVIHFALIQIHLIGMAGKYKESFNCDHVIKLIFTFGKVIEHSVSYLAKIQDWMKENNFDSMAHMAILIKI